MSSRFLKVVATLAILVAPAIAADQLKVCSDPANLPFSDAKQRGFENRIAELLARDLHAQLTYHWSRLGRGFIRNVVNKGECDVLVGVPVGMRGLDVIPYYRSTYVFVTRRGAHAIASFDDPALKSMKIGVQILEEDYAPPASALARRGLAANVVGFDIDGDNAGSIISAVASKKINVAIVWGPFAGYYAKKYGNALVLRPVTPEVDPPQLRFAYEIGIGVRKGRGDLADRIQSTLANERPRVDRILRDYNIPTEPLNASADQPSAATARHGE